MTHPCPGPLPAQLPSYSLPPGACDSHVHVMGPYDRYPLAAERAYTAPAAPRELLQEVLTTLGFDRVVIAHVSACGPLLDVTLDALAYFGDKARGTAILPVDTSTAEIARLHDAGMRGIRLSPAYGRGTPIDAETLETWAQRIAPFGWHIAMWPTDAAELALLRRLAPTLPVQLVIDHLGSHAWDPAQGFNQPGFDDLLGLLDTGNVWLKLSGMYRASIGAYPWPEWIAFGAKLLKHNPERMLWASDWPHVGVWDRPMPSSDQLLNWLVDIGADATQRERILVHNPARLFDFPALR